VLKAKKPKGQGPLYRRIYERLKGSMESGELPAGARIAPSSKLAERFGCGIFAVQRAMSALEREGLVERRQRLGSFVKGSRPRLSKAAIYFDTDFWRLGGMDFYRLLCGELQLAMDAEGVEHRVFLDRQTGVMRRHFPKELLKAARSGEIQAVVALLLSNVSQEAFKELGVPVVRLSSLGSGNVDFDMDGMLSLSGRSLAAQGARSVGMLSSVSGAEGLLLQERFSNAARREGLRPSSLDELVPASSVNSCDLESFGYSSFMRLQKSGRRPDGILVYPDIMAKGLAMAVLESGVKVPRDLKLVIHENEGNPIFRPFQAATVASSSAAVAKALLDQARSLCAGANPGVQKIPYKLLSPPISIYEPLI